MFVSGVEEWSLYLNLLSKGFFLRSEKNKKTERVCISFCTYWIWFLEESLFLLCL